MNTLSKQNRDNYLDSVRGLAALGIIAVHTVFWSGVSYGVPQWLQSLSLAIDVGMFFFLSGWAISFKERSPWDGFKSILNTWKQWVFFVCVIGIVLIPFGGGISGFSDLISNFCFQVSIPRFAVIAGSIWFMPVYITVSLINVLVIYVINHTTEKPNRVKSYFHYLLFLLFLILFQSRNTILLPIDHQFAFYSVFYIVGLIFGSKQISLKTWHFVAGLAVIVSGMILSSNVLNTPIFPMQDNKFPPNLIYLFYTFIGIWCAIFARKYFKNVKNNILSHIGRKAIWFYFSQGIGSSVLGSLAEQVQIGNTYLKCLVLFLINVGITFACSEVLSFCYMMICKLFDRIKKAVLAHTAQDIS